MRYPYLFFGTGHKPRPLFTGLTGAPYLLDLSKESTLIDTETIRDQRRFQKTLEKKMAEHTWGLSAYLEDRRTLLTGCEQMIREGRYFHLGMDIIVPVGTPLHAPLDAVVYETGYEAGDGNYGGYVLLKHEIETAEPFYSFYGHLAAGRVPAKGTVLKAGEAFSFIGDFEFNGNWFYHTHLQVITNKGLEEGFMLKGYCTAGDLPRIPELCPSPLHLFGTK